MAKIQFQTNFEPSRDEVRALATEIRDRLKAEHERICKLPIEASLRGPLAALVAHQRYLEQTQPTRHEEFEGALAKARQGVGALIRALEVLKPLDQACLFATGGRFWDQNMGPVEDEDVSRATATAIRGLADLSRRLAAKRLNAPDTLLFTFHHDVVRLDRGSLGHWLIVLAVSVLDTWLGPGRKGTLGLDRRLPSGEVDQTGWWLVSEITAAAAPESCKQLYGRACKALAKDLGRHVLSAHTRGPELVARYRRLADAALDSDAPPHAP